MSSISLDDFTQPTTSFQWIGTKTILILFLTLLLKFISSHNHPHKQNRVEAEQIPALNLNWNDCRPNNIPAFFYTSQFSSVCYQQGGKRTQKNKSFRKYSILLLCQVADNYKKKALNQPHNETRSQEGCGLICLLFVLAVIYSEPGISFISWGCRSTSKATPSASQPQGWSNFQWPVITHTVPCSEQSKLHHEVASRLRRLILKERNVHNRQSMTMSNRTKTNISMRWK